MVEACTKEESVGIWPDLEHARVLPLRVGACLLRRLKENVCDRMVAQVVVSGTWTHRRLVTEFFEGVAAQETVRVIEAVLKWLFEKGRGHSRRWARPGFR